MRRRAEVPALPTGFKGWLRQRGERVTTAGQNFSLWLDAAPLATGRRPAVAADPACAQSGTKGTPDPDPAAPQPAQDVTAPQGAQDIEVAPANAPAAAAPPARRRKLTKTKPKGREGDTVHHLWLPVGAFPTTEEAKPGKVPLPAGELACLASWQPHPQILWTYTEIDLPPALAPAVLLAPLDDFMPSTMARWLLAFGVPVQMVKDILSLMILHAHGGLFTDLDVFWLGRPVPKPEGFTFGDEPPSQVAGAVKGRQWNAVHLGLLGMPKGHPLPKELAEKFLQYWTQVALRGVEVGCPAEETTQRKDWMHNTKLLSSRVAACPRLAACVQVPLTLLPLTRRMSLRQFEDLAAAAAEEAAVTSDGRVDITVPYRLPSLALMAQRSCTVNLWLRHWPEPLQHAVLKWRAATRSANLARARAECVGAASGGLAGGPGSSGARGAGCGSPGHGPRCSVVRPEPSRASGSDA